MATKITKMMVKLKHPGQKSMDKYGSLSKYPIICRVFVVHVGWLF